MNLQGVALSQIPAPRIVDDYSRSKLGGLYYRLNLASILRAHPSSFRQKEINCALFVAVATLEKRVVVEERLQAILGHPALEELIAHCFWHQNIRKQKTQPWKKIQMIESDNARAIDRTAGRTHEN